MEIISKSLKDTESFAEHLIDRIESTKKSSVVVFLNGNLGSGKTALTQILAKKLHSVQSVVSPTYLIFKEIDIVSDSFTKIYHFDLYRIKSKKELEVLGLSEKIKTENAIFIFEWGSVAKDWNIVPDIIVECEDLGGDKKYKII